MAQPLQKGLLKNRFYKGQFWWEEKLYSGMHSYRPIGFEQVQRVFRGYKKPHYGTHDFAYRGLLTCAYDNCKVTAEIWSERYEPTMAVQGTVENVFTGFSRGSGPKTSRSR
jgi:hypothetical protein